MDYIHKPFSSAVVKARVHTHLVLRGIREQLSHQLTAIRSELETARQIQLSILPGKMPKIHGLDLAARYLPMTEVAGDFYDFIVVDDNHLGVLDRGRIRSRHARRTHLFHAEDRTRRAILIRIGSRRSPLQD